MVNKTGDQITANEKKGWIIIRDIPVSDFNFLD